MTRILCPHIRPVVVLLQPKQLNHRFCWARRTYTYWRVFI